MAGLLNLTVDHRPKIRKRAQEAITKVLKNPPPSPAVDHPAADMCAETALKSLSDLAARSTQAKKQRKSETAEHEPALIHALQLVKTVAAASSGWPSKKIEALCEVLLNIDAGGEEVVGAVVGGGDGVEHLLDVRGGGLLGGDAGGAGSGGAFVLGWVFDGHKCHVRRC